MTMRLLVCAQTVDTKDPFNGFFVEWLREFSGHYSHIHVLSLAVGVYALPSSVSVFSLGKDDLHGPRFFKRLCYIWRILRKSWELRHAYDAVFVHQSQEFVLVAGFLWGLCGKRIYLWRNHYAGNMFTDMASLFCTSVFYTSRFSYTAGYPNARQMPVGVDTNLFKDTRTARKPRSVLYAGRIAPAKRPHVLIDALRALSSRNIPFSAALIGSTLPTDSVYRKTLIESIKEYSLDAAVTVREGLPHRELAAVFNSYEVFINLSESGMLDKTIFEAAACGAIPLAASKDFLALAGEDFFFRDVSDLERKVEKILHLTDEEKHRIRTRLLPIIQEHSLRTLGLKLKDVMTI